MHTMDEQEKRLVLGTGSVCDTRYLDVKRRKKKLLTDLNGFSQEVDLLGHMLFFRIKSINVLLYFLIRVPHVGQSEFFFELSNECSLFLY